MTIESYTKEVEDLFIQFLYTDPEVFVKGKEHYATSIF